MDLPAVVFVGLMSYKSESILVYLKSNKCDAFHSIPDKQKVLESS